MVINAPAAVSSKAPPTIQDRTGRTSAAGGRPREIHRRMAARPGGEVCRNINGKDKHIP